MLIQPKYNHNLPSKFKFTHNYNIPSHSVVYTAEIKDGIVCVTWDGMDGYVYYDVEDVQESLPAGKWVITEVI